MRHPQSHDRRADDHRKGWVGVVMNGKGLFISRMMMIAGFPIVTGIVTGLAAYAGNAILGKFEQHFSFVESKLGELSETTNAISKDVASLRIDVTVLQTQESDIKEQIKRK